MKPRIGITCSTEDEHSGRYRVSASYVKAVIQAGGLPLLLPCEQGIDAAEIAATIDGLLLPGGGDVDPEWFGEEPTRENGRIDPIADRFEIELCRVCLKESRPVLGVCRGIQVLNIAAGGDIYQDLVTQTDSKIQHHQKAPRWHATHTVDIRPGSLLQSITGHTQLRVNTFHHQAVRRVANGFRPVAHSRDGLIEAIEGQGEGFALGVQWHPECRLDVSEPDRALFRALVAACGRG